MTSKMDRNETSSASADRKKLMEKLDKDIEEFIESRPKTEYKDGFSEDNWENEMQLHPVFRTDPIKEGEELPPLIEAMQQLKYDPNENTPTELATNYKEDGNYNFKLKNYRWAINSYTEGIKLQCEDGEINAQLYTNRAAAHYYLGNFRSAIKDCTAAIKHKPDHIKAILRAVKCCEQLKNYEEGISWCDKGLNLDNKNEELTKIKTTFEKQKKVAERDERKSRIASKKLHQEEETVVKAIKERGIRIANRDGSYDINLSSFEPCHPAAHGSRVYQNETGQLIWPVLFMYPEYGQTDFIQQFNENDCFAVHLESMFDNESERPPWDLDGSYNTKSLKIYFEENDDTLWEVKSSESLGNVLKHSCYKVQGGTPAFIIAVQSSTFHQQFRKRYKTVKLIS